MAKYKMTLMGLYQYSNTLFDQLVFPVWSVPSQPSVVQFTPDKDTLIAVILEKGGDFPILYPNFEFMQYMIGVWSTNTAYMMEKLYQTQNYRYNAIHNYDRTGKITRNSSSNRGGIVTGSQTAFNSDSFKDTGKSTSVENGSGSETVEETVSGNIGVTSTQQMLQQERDLAYFKWYDIIADDFINKFCIQIF